jgi:ABC-type glutathione transport system ATPase component
MLISNMFSKKKKDKVEEEESVPNSTPAADASPEGSSGGINSSGGVISNSSSSTSIISKSGPSSSGMKSSSKAKGKKAVAAAALLEARLNAIPSENYRSLEEAYAKLAESEDVKKMLQKLFKTLRIMVVGRSGSGKTTIIRLVMGEKGPRSITVGTSGVQDISVEWHHPDEDVPLVFHDSNGIDNMGAQRLEDIRKFLEPHQNDNDNFGAKVILLICQIQSYDYDTWAYSGRY